MNRWIDPQRHGGRRWLATGLLLAALLAATVSGGAAAPRHQPAAPPAGEAASVEQSPLPPEALEDPEAAFQPDYLHLATGDLDTLQQVPQYAWPYDLLSIGHTMASYQNYGSNPYFHHGIDGRVDAGDPVYATSGGQVVNIENYQPGNDLYWEIAILDPDGFLWQFHHIEVDSIPQAIWDKYDEFLADPINGGFIAAGTLIGEVVYWPVVTFGERFNHIHLNILDGDGDYVNGFAFLEPLNDNQVPEIQAVGLFQNGAILAGNQVTGNYSLYARVRDLILHTAFYVPPYDLTVAIDDGPEQTVWRFDNLPGGGDRYAYVSNFFVPPTCGNYDCRDFYIDLGFIPGGARAFPTSGGQHSAVVTARDYAGNQISQTFTWTVVGPPSGTVAFFDDFESATTPNYIWTTNPAGTDNATAGFWESGNPESTTQSGAKQLGTTVSGNEDLVTGRLAGANAGTYDVDSGVTSVRSPDIALPASSRLTLSFYSYLAHTASSTADYFRITVVESAAQAAQEGRAPNATVVWEEVGVNSNRNAAWAFHTADIAAYSGQTVYLLIEAADGGAQNILEAAVDDVQITRTGPLAIVLADFSAVQQGDAISLTWETNSELNNSGFNLWRGVSESEPDRQLNEMLIPSQAPGSPNGFIYTWEDRADLVPGTTYYYWIEDVDMAGTVTRHGPVSASYAIPTAVQVSELRADTTVAGSLAPLAGVWLAWLALLAGALLALLAPLAVRRWE